jgi:hypothetical protein
VEKELNALLEQLAAQCKYGKCADSRTQACAALGCLGKLKCMEKQNVFIGTCLLDTLNSFGAGNNADILTIECASAAVNSIIDIYSEDDEHVQAIQTVQLISKLQQFLPAFTKSVKKYAALGQGKMDKEVLENAEEACENLGQFIVYKKSH